MMMNISLKRFVITMFLITGLVLVLGYSLVCKYFYHKGMESITSVQLEGVVETYLRVVPVSKRQTLQHFERYYIAPRWELMPRMIKDVVGDVAPTKRLMIKGVNRRWFGPPHGTVFVWRFERDGQTYYISRQDRPPPRESLIAENTRNSLSLLFAIGVGTVLLLTLMAYLLYQLVSRPIILVEKWASSLDAESLKREAPNFIFPELNTIAQLMRTSLSSVEEGLHREHKFLRHVSHELRTPIAVIRNNVELFDRVGERGQYDKQKKMIARIDRASQNMEDLTETILWLSRENTINLSPERFDIEEMVQEAVRDLSYLLERKHVEITLQTTDHIVLLPKIPVQIIVTNLVRNAFQHSWDGLICIQQLGHQITILNPRSSLTSEAEDLGFGLGLKLTKGLVQKLGWSFIDQSSDHFYKVCIVFDDESNTSSL